MNIAVSYIDYNLANIKERELFSFTKTKLHSIYEQILKKDGVLGSVIISTCNRTEIYLSFEENVFYEPFSLLCEICNINDKNCNEIHKTLFNEDVIVHLCNLSCGILSQIWGEGQIISQVKQALCFARENNVTDNILEVVFRNAITCGKRVRTLIEFSNENHSAAHATLKMLNKNNNIKNVLVVGNGAMGKLVATTLVKNGYNVFITIRRYKYHDAIVPPKTTAVEYDERYIVMENVQAVVSATLSPHYTIRFDDYIKIKNKPKIVVDLAVPRDVDSRIGNIENVECFNIDEISCYDVNTEYKKQILEKIKVIRNKYINDFYKWYNYKLKITLEV